MTSGHVREPLTRSAEDYLKAIYHLTSGRGTGSVAATTDLAQALDLSPASVSGMLRRLAEQGYVEHEPYRGVQLTGEGRRVALRMLRRHRLLEAYLVAHLGYTWDTVHEEAERREHAVSDELGLHYSQKIRQFSVALCHKYHPIKPQRNTVLRSIHA